MKRKRHIFIDFSIISSIIMTVIIFIYTLAQLVMIVLYTKNYQEDYVRNRYEVLSYVFSKINPDENSIIGVVSDNENIRIYKEDLSRYYSNDYDEDVWEDIDLYFGRDLKIETKNKLMDNYTVLSGPIYINREKYIIQLVLDDEFNDDFIEGYYSIFLIVFIFGISLSILGATRLSKKILKKINKISDEIEEVKLIGVSHRINTSDSNDEFDKISKLFNSMMDEIEDTFEEQKMFVSNVSHELRTPLTALKGHLSLIKRHGADDKNMVDKSIGICINETDRLIKIVQEMLMLTRTERETVNLSEVSDVHIMPLINEVIENYKVLKENVYFNTKVNENGTLKITKEHFKQLLVIFIDNSIKYNDKDICRITISLNESNGKKEFVITDNGIGIPKEDIPYVLNKFYKVDKSRLNNNSYGIGLSIAKQIVKNYKGEIIISSEEKVYTKIKIIF